MGDVLLLDPQLAPALRAAGLATAEDLLGLGGDPTRHRVGAFLELDLGGVAQRCYLKRYHYPDWRTSRGLLGRGSLWGVPPEINEYQALTWLRRNDLPAVRPLAAAARTRRRRLVAHALLTAAVEDAPDLAQRLATTDDPLRTSHGLRRATARCIGAAVGRMHRLGFLHRDLHARNILVRIEPEPVTVWLLDCRRGGVGGRKGPQFDLATLDRDLRGHLSRGERRHALDAYLEARGLDTRRDAPELVRGIAAAREALGPRRR